jgi:HEAT repeat protein
MNLSRRSIFHSTLISVAFATNLCCGTVGFSQKISPEKERELIAVLRSKDPDADKAIACKKLAIDGSRDAVPELAALLKDERLASWARIALEAIPDKSADEALIKATYTLQGKLLVGTINSIGVRRDPAAVDSLKVRLLDKDIDVARAAAVALGRIGNTNAAQFLGALLANAQPELRTAVAQGLVYCAEQSAEKGNVAEAIKIYDDIRNAKVSMQRIVEATRGAILLRKLDGIPLLVEQLRSPEKELFEIGLATARELEGKSVDQALAAELQRAAPDRAALLIYAMADRTDTVELPSILNAAKAGPSVVRVAAINALARVGNTSCVPTLLAIAGESDLPLAIAAKTALAEIPDEGVNKAIAELLPKAEGRMLASLIEVVGLRQIEATKELMKSLNNSDKSIRGAALVSLGNTIPPSQMSVLIQQVVAPKQAEDLDIAIQALKTAAIRMPDRDECSSKLATAAEGVPLATKTTLLEVLGAVGGTKALQVIQKSAKSEDPQLRDVSTKLLGEWMTVDAAPVLLDLAKTLPTDKFQGRAVSGYIRIARQFVKNESERVAMFKNAMEASRQTKEQKLVLDTLKVFPSLETLKLAAKAAEVNELKEAASQAALAIAEKVANKEQAGEILAKAGITKAN